MFQGFSANPSKLHPLNQRTSRSTARLKPRTLPPGTEPHVARNWARPSSSWDKSYRFVLTSCHRKPWKSWHVCRWGAWMSRWKLGSMVRINGLFHLLINGVYRVIDLHNPFTNHLLTSWDIQLWWPYFFLGMVGGSWWKGSFHDLNKRVRYSVTWWFVSSLWVRDFTKKKLYSPEV